MKKIISSVLVLMMVISMFAFPGGVSFAADDDGELIVLAAKKANEITDIMPKLTSDKKYVQTSKFSAKWQMDAVGTVGAKGLPEDISAYNELKMTLYSNANTTMYVYFETANNDTDGMDAFTKQLKIKEGWQDISLDLSKMSKSRKPSWKSVKGISFNSSGWGQTVVPGSTVYFDRISLCYNADYGDPSATPTPTPTPKPEGEAGNARYFAQDFENTDSVDVKYAGDNLITLEEKDGNHYMQITKAGEKDVHVSTSLKYTSRYIVMSADYATTKYPGTTQLLTCKSSTAQHTFLSLTSAGEILAGGKGSRVAGTLKADGKFVNIAIIGDFDNRIYDVYVDGKLAVEKVKMPSDFSYPTMHRIYLNKGTGDKGANLMVDNIRVFDGKSLDDFDKTISVTEAEASSFAEMIGKPSPIIEMGTFVINQINQENAVAMNVHSGYIHAKGKKSMPDVPAYIKDGRTLLPVRAVSEALDCTVGWDAETRTVTINDKTKITIDSKEMILPDGSTYMLDVPAEITEGRTFIPLRALCEKVLGKTVFWNDRGLIVLSDKEIELTNAKIIALNNYLLYDRPLGAELKETFNSVNGSTHPRVILNANDFARILSEYNTNEYMNEWGNNVIATAEGHVASPHEVHKLVNDSILSTSRNVLAKSLNLAMAYKLTGREEFKTYLWEEMQNVCSVFPDWNHQNHYLDTGEMTTAVGIAYDWLYDEWTEEQRKVMEEGIYNKSLVWTQKAQYGKCDYPHFFVTATTNWNAACSGGVGVGAMAVFEKYPDICSDIIEKAFVSLEAMLKEFYPHGAWYEGVSYTRYLMEYVTFFVSTSENTFGSDYNLTKTAGFEGAAQYYLNSEGIVSQNNFHDAGTGHLASTTFMWFSKYMNQPGVTQTILSRMEKFGKKGDIYAFIYYDTNVKKDENVSLPLDTYYGGTEIASLRSSWTDDNGVYVSFHSGATEVNHGHLDSGTFVIDMGGQRFAHDLGADDYNAPGYFGTTRYDYYRTRPEGHNVFVINPDASKGQVLGVSDAFTKFETKSKGGFAITELSNAYRNYAQSARRGIMLGDERRSILIRDEIRGMKKTENEVYWLMQLMKTNVEIVDKSTVILERNGVRAKLQILSDAKDCEIEVTPARPFEKSPDPETQNKNGGYQRLVLKFKTGKDVNINVKVSLLYDIFGDTPIVEKPLDEWSIPDGELVVLENPFPEFPKAKSIMVDGVVSENFESDTTAFAHMVPYGTTKVEKVEAVVDDNIEVSEIIVPESVPGNAIITLTDKNDRRLTTTYTVTIRSRNETEIIASGFQEGNEPEDCLDGDLDTRWAVEGDSYGIFTFANPKKVSSVWIATWKAKERKLIFEIEVSEDGENFTQVWSGQTAAVEDVLEEIKIPEGTYKAIKLVMHGTTTGSWNSILEVDFS